MWYWLPPAIWGAIILVGTSLPRAPLPPGITGIDKISHLIAYGVLGLLLMRAFTQGKRFTYGKSVASTVIAGGAFAGFDEIHQGWIPGRSPDVMDFAADLVGLILAVVAIWALNRLRSIERLRSIARNTNSTTSMQTEENEEMTIMAEAKHVDQDEFEDEVLNAGVPALVDFWAPWCGPCQMMGPTIDKLAGDYEGDAVIAKLNVDDAPDIASKYGVRSIPALLFFSDGEVVDQLVGVQSEDALREKLDSLI